MARLIHITLLSFAGITVVLWAVSYGLLITAVAPLWGPYSRLALHHVRGRMELSVHTHWPYQISPRIQGMTLADMESTGFFTNSVLRPSMFGFSHIDLTRHAGWRMTGVTLRIPHWLLIGLLIAWPAFTWVRKRYRSPTSAQCSSCGYDLRGLVNAQCPECGASIEAAPSQSRQLAGDAREAE